MGKEIYSSSAYNMKKINEMDIYPQVLGESCSAHQQWQCTENLTSQDLQLLIAEDAQPWGSAPSRCGNMGKFALPERCMENNAHSHFIRRVQISAINCQHISELVQLAGKSWRHDVPGWQEDMGCGSSDITKRLMFYLFHTFLSASRTYGKHSVMKYLFRCWMLSWRLSWRCALSKDHYHV